MSGTPKLKFFTPAGEYEASCKHPTSAAALCALYGAGSEVRWGHSKSNTLYTEGEDGEAAESYDRVAETIINRAPDYAF